MMAQKLADMSPVSHDSAAALSEGHKSETVASMEAYTFRYLFFMHEKQMLDALMKIRPRDGDSLNRFFQVDFMEEAIALENKENKNASDA
jgi:hypothetical protein